MINLKYRANDKIGTHYIPSIGSDTKFLPSINPVYFSSHIEILLVKGILENVRKLKNGFFYLGLKIIQIWKRTRKKRFRKFIRLPP